MRTGKNRRHRTGPVRSKSTVPTRPSISLSNRPEPMKSEPNKIITTKAMIPTCTTIPPLLRLLLPSIYVDLWAIADQDVRKNAQLNKILTASAEILASKHGLEFTDTDTDRAQLCNFFDRKAQQIEDQKWVFRLGEHTFEVREQLVRVSKKSLAPKDIITAGASASPPAAIACAALTTCFAGLESTSALIPRLCFTESLYLEPQAKVSIGFLGKLQETFVSVYSKILEFQARAVCYLHRYSISQALGDIFDRDGWNDLLKDFERFETETNRFASLIADAESRERHQQLLRRIDSILSALGEREMWAITSARNEKPHLLTDSVLAKGDIDGDELVHSFSTLWGILNTASVNEKAEEILCILDSLDECAEDDRKRLIRAVNEFYLGRQDSNKLKPAIIHLSGEGEKETHKISDEINLVIKKRAKDIREQRNLEVDEYEHLVSQITAVENRTYLWVSLILDVLENMPAFTKGNVRRAIHNLLQTVDSAYERILQRSSDLQKARGLLHLITAAMEPLSLGAMSLALALALASESGHQAPVNIRDEIEPEYRFKRTLRDLCGLFLVVVDGKI
ncbi:uncharacterized protein KD926_009738 [Aspergillus affinis]|uniref:uncharacterized protein n=1 Tax=Aspergillus affinis TaxID=1070780 RepID=UPI0022FED6A1|nr:uncharacterized protein KD926_009738 [Aspergillus affinis]KAI9039296.1 hypothetical protein KD926_009738 [Aspergillus affinis]